MPAFVVSIDGPDLTGKSTIANLLIERLRKTFPKKIIKKTEVPSTLITGFFPKMLRNSADKIDTKVIALAYALDHLHHYNTVIKPLIESKEDYLVVQERSLLSTLIYQSILGGVDLDWVLEINKHDKNIPDLQIIIFHKLEELLKRKQLERKDSDIYETEEHIKRQIELYLNIPSFLVEKFSVILHDTTNKDAEQVAKEIEELVKAKIGSTIVQQEL